MQPTLPRDSATVMSSKAIIFTYCVGLASVTDFALLSPFIGNQNDQSPIIWELANEDR